MCCHCYQESFNVNTPNAIVRVYLWTEKSRGQKGWRVIEDKEWQKMIEEDREWYIAWYMLRDSRKDRGW